MAGIKESREEAPAARSAFVLSRERPSLSTEPASAPNLPQHRTCLSTEASSVLPRVKIASQPEMSFWNSRGSGRVLAAIIRRWREQRMRISEFTAYSLLFTVISGKEKSRIPVIPDAAGGCTESSVARWPFVKKFAVKFADKFAVPRTPVNSASFRMNPLLYVAMDACDRHARFGMKPRKNANNQCR